MHSLVFASSGALLLCCVDRSGQLAGLRKRMREAFPGAQAAPFPHGLFASAAGRYKLVRLCECAAKQECRSRSRLT